MKDELDNFINQNRSSFDELEPRKETWSKIETGLKNDSSKKSDLTWVWKAAAMVFLCLSAALLIEKYNNSESQLAENDRPKEKNETPEWQQAEVYYTQLISQKRTEIKSVLNKKQLTDVELLEDLKQMDEMYLGLKEDLSENQNDKRLIDAMIRNLQLRVEILNRQLKILEKISKHEEHEKISV
jgi:hypothetical protein